MSSEAGLQTRKGTDEPEKAEQNMVETVRADGIELRPGPLPKEELDYLSGLRNLEIRPDDVFVCAFPKAGTNWTWEIVSMLLRGTAEYEPIRKTAMMVEGMSTEKATAMPSPRVFNAHALLRFLPYQIREKGAKIVYVTRNPKDVAVSFYHHTQNLKDDLRFTGTFTEFLHERFLFPTVTSNWFKSELDWEKTRKECPDLKIITMVYEDMKEDLCTHVARLSEFLGTGASKELCQQIAEACSFDNLKEANKKKPMSRPTNPFARPQIIKYVSPLRKGQVGDWKNWFTVAQNEIFDKVYAEKMKGSKLTYRMNIAD